MSYNDNASSILAAVTKSFESAADNTTSSSIQSSDDYSYAIISNNSIDLSTLKQEKDEYHSIKEDESTTHSSRLQRSLVRPVFLYGLGFLLLFLVIGYTIMMVMTNPSEETTVMKSNVTPLQQGLPRRMLNQVNNMKTWMDDGKPMYITRMLQDSITTRIDTQRSQFYQWMELQYGAITTIPRYLIDLWYYFIKPADILSSTSTTCNVLSS
ncbi:uncharacterized protein BX664DRAFT_334104 [Halteromyces radiatus]|uniref:uncharacterized protein n=1 Tax=Halteromyces radiatus TaxID=101107 RepID=UPI00221FA29A|nr:uncharacterized protein BX664DRAFT_334104 [Halteromyces radiatus]KAI8089863.1 hypothetical protein BX664DRAFT_334104 [Halteromyces radiatus]